jgi:hypothetical protein
VRWERDAIWPSFLPFGWLQCFVETVYTWKPWWSNPRHRLTPITRYNIFLTHLFLTFGQVLLSLFAASKSESLHQQSGKLPFSKYSSSYCGFSLGLWQRMWIYVCTLGYKFWLTTNSIVILFFPTMWFLFTFFLGNKKGHNCSNVFFFLVLLVK